MRRRIAPSGASEQALRAARAELEWWQHRAAKDRPLSEVEVDRYRALGNHHMPDIAVDAIIAASVAAPAVVASLLVERWAP